MAHKQGLTIRTKILLMLTLVPVLTLGLFLFIALGVFENDKVAYVFESTSSVSRSLSSQVSTELNASLLAVKPVFQEFLTFGQFGPVTQSLFQNDSPLVAVAAFSFLNGKPQQLELAEKFQDEGKNLFRSFGDLTLLFQQAQTQGRALRVPFKDEKVVFVERVKSPRQEVYFVYVSLMSSIAEVFRSPQSAEIFLVNENGFIFFGSPGFQAPYLTEKINLDFLANFKDQRFQTGTEEVKGKDGATWLASFSKVSFGDLMVVSLVPKKEALKAVQLLLRKSIVFFLLLISITAMVGLVASGSLTSALTDLFQATKRVAEGKFDIRVNVKSSDEVGSLASSFNAMAEEVSRLLLETAEKARMEGELKTAQTVQETLFPAPEADLGGFQVSGYYEPASECGGDWWHYCLVGHKIYLWIGDATGHGAPAALITSAAKSAATIIERLDVDPKTALGLLNRAIYDVSKGRIMMTFFLACFDKETRTFTYANASHEAPYLIQKTDQQLKKKHLVPLNEVNNPRLGQDRETQYEQTSFQLEVGDRILYYTDGIPDIQNQSQQSWGEREFIKNLLWANENFPPIHESVSILRDKFSTFRENAPLVDDITFFMTDFTGRNT